VPWLAKHSHNIGTNEKEELVFYYNSEEQCTLNVSDVECIHDFSECSDDIVASNKV
jgi:hypothetical protein